MKISLTKFIATSGWCSRRQAEKLIKNKKVKVNGQVASLGAQININDCAEINGKKLYLPKKKIYIKLNKPKGYVCTNAKFKGEKSVFELLPFFNKLFIVGRLDKNSRGLVIFTNDGEWANRVIHPRYHYNKYYECRLFNFKNGQEKNIIKRFKEGIDIKEGDGIVKVKSIKYLGRDKFEILLTEGKKRQIRRMFASLGYQVKDLLRTKIGLIELGNLKEGQWQKIDKI